MDKLSERLQKWLGNKTLINAFVFLIVAILLLCLVLNNNELDKILDGNGETDVETDVTITSGDKSLSINKKISHNPANETSTYESQPYNDITTNDSYYHDTYQQPSPYSVPYSISYSSGLEALPELRHIDTATVPYDTNAYTGPNFNYYRTASGNASVPAGYSVNIYGATNDFVLVKYLGSRNEGRESVYRFSFIPQSALSYSGIIPNLNLHYLPIRISNAAKLIDAPESYRTGYSNATYINRDAYALARIIVNDITWIYFESNFVGINENKAVRGFVSAGEVTPR